MESDLRPFIVENPNYDNDDWEAENSLDKLLVDDIVVDFNHVSVGPAVQGKEMHRLDFFYGIGSILWTFGGQGNDRDISEIDATKENVELITRQNVAGYISMIYESDPQYVMNELLDLARAPKIEWPKSAFNLLLFGPKFSPQPIKKTVWVWTEVAAFIPVSDRVLKMSGVCQAYL